MKQFVSSLIALLCYFISTGQNPIASENALPGTPSSEWQIAGAGDLSIQGFATDISINKGETVHFKIKTDAAAYTVEIYRLGYYNGMGARHVGTATIMASLPQTQPEPITDAVTGLVDCGNWSESANWAVPSNAVSGVYIALLKRTDNDGSSHIVFIVRDDASNADLYFKTSDATWQAYNVYGGNSLYVGTTSLPSGHASKVSYNRPVLTRNGGGGGFGADWLFNAEYAMIRFLERNGYNISYNTDIDIVRSANLILNHKVLLSVGHDEYWSAEQRNNVEAARNAGIHLAFFSGNEIYWKTRWENSYDGTNTPYKTLVCYKEGTMGENVCGEKCDPSSTWTGLWRDGCEFPSSDGCNPENSLSGQMSWQLTSGTSIEVPSDYKNFRFWRNTSIASLGSGSSAIFPPGTLGFEWDWEQYPNNYPSGRITLSSTTVNGKTHKLSLYRHSSGALVFGAGTIQWSWGLDDQHDFGGSPVSQDMQQATINLFADMGVQPATLQSDLVPATQSSDNQAPVTTISSLSHGASVPVAEPITIVGTSTDNATIAGIEISFDGGITWRLANGTSNWNYTWTPTTMGTFTIKVRGYDDSGNMETTGSVPSNNAITITVTNPQYPINIFQLTDTATVQNKYDNIAGIELGVKFRSAINGYITGIRFYKSSNDIGIHIGSLWTSGGTLLAQTTFTNESASGWQEVSFSSPVSVTAGSIYVASYNSPTGYYSATNPYFTTDIISGPLTAIATTDINGPNGVFEYSSTPVFPSQGFQSANYWVDVVFDEAAIDTGLPKIISSSPGSNATNVSVNSSFYLNFNEAIDPATINSSTVTLTNSSNATVPVTLNYNNGYHRIMLTPVSALNYSSDYTITVIGGASGIKDISGNALAADTSLSFKTINAPVTTTTLTGQVTLQGRPAAPNAQWQVPITIELYVTGNSTPVQTFTTTTNTSGQFSISGIPVGAYNIKVKNSHTLARVKLNQTLISGGNNIDFGTLLEGDANNDNVIDFLDFSILSSTYNKTQGDPGYDGRADFNNDFAVDLLDFSVSLPNYNINGEENP